MDTWVVGSYVRNFGIGDPSQSGVARQALCLGSRNPGCLEVGRLARSPSCLRAVEGAAC